MRVTFAVMEMHMRKRPHLVVLTELVAPAQTPVAQSKTASTFAQGLSLEESLLARGGMSPSNTPRAVALRQLPGRPCQI
jgi:hypothetical protein